MKALLPAALTVFLFAAAESCGNPVGAESPGPKGDPGVSGYEVLTDKLFIPIGVTLTTTVDCPLNKVAISGGWSFHGLELNVLYSHPGSTTGEAPTSTDRRKWTFRMENTGSAPDFVDLYAICVYAT